VTSVLRRRFAERTSAPDVDGLLLRKKSQTGSNIRPPSTFGIVNRIEARHEYIVGSTNVTHKSQPHIRLALLSPRLRPAQASSFPPNYRASDKKDRRAETDYENNPPSCETECLPVMKRKYPIKKSIAEGIIPGVMGSQHFARELIDPHAASTCAAAYFTRQSHRDPIYVLGRQR